MFIKKKQMAIFQMAEGESSQMMEGFLCPICKSDYGTAMKLLNHFQDEHSDEQDLLKSFKGKQSFQTS